MDKDFLALEAERLAKDPVFIEVLQRIKTSSVEKLIATNASDTTTIIYLQCMAKIADLFPAELQAMMQSSKDAKPRAVV